MLVPAINVTRFYGYPGGSLFRKRINRRKDGIDSKLSGHVSLLLVERYLIDFQRRTGRYRTNPVHWIFYR